LSGNQAGLRILDIVVVNEDCSVRLETRNIASNRSEWQRAQ